jgi:hypothetical protein
VRAKPGLVRLGGTADLRGDWDASLHFLDACIASGRRVNDLSPQVSAATLRQGWSMQRSMLEQGPSAGAWCTSWAWPGMCVDVKEDAVSAGEPGTPRRRGQVALCRT